MKRYDMVYVGKDCDYLTYGKIYEVSETEITSEPIFIQSVRDDSGFIYILTESENDEPHTSGISDFITIGEWRERKLGELGI